METEKLLKETNEMKELFQKICATKNGNRLEETMLKFFKQFNYKINGLCMESSGRKEFVICYPEDPITREISRIDIIWKRNVDVYVIRFYLLGEDHISIESGNRYSFIGRCIEDEVNISSDGIICGNELYLQTLKFFNEELILFLKEEYSK